MAQKLPYNNYEYDIIRINHYKSFVDIALPSDTPYFSIREKIHKIAHEIGQCTQNYAKGV